MICFLYSALPVGMAQQKQVQRDEDEAYTSISNKYFSGRFLLYDCDEHHWACVDKGSYNNCSSIRQKAWANREKFLLCAPFKEYPKINECVQQQMLLVNKISAHKYCFYPQKKDD